MKNMMSWMTVLLVGLSLAVIPACGNPGAKNNEPRPADSKEEKKDDKKEAKKDDSGEQEQPPTTRRSGRRKASRTDSEPAPVSTRSTRSRAR